MKQSKIEQPQKQKGRITSELEDLFGIIQEGKRWRIATPRRGRDNANDIKYLVGEIEKSIPNHPVDFKYDVSEIRKSYRISNSKLLNVFEVVGGVVSLIGLAYAGQVFLNPTSPDINPNMELFRAGASFFGGVFGVGIAEYIRHNNADAFKEYESLHAQAQLVDRLKEK